MSDGKITLYIATSVDGYVATEDGGVKFLEEFQQETEREYRRRGLRRILRHRRLSRDG